MPNEAVGKVPKIKKRPNWGYQNGTFARDLFLYAKYGRLFFHKFFDLSFSTGPTLKLSRNRGTPYLSLVMPSLWSWLLAPKNAPHSPLYALRY